MMCCCKYIGCVAVNVQNAEMKRNVDADIFVHPSEWRARTK